ncbi:hypothetical protein DP73_13780 [Desulfosporosinus sp. HMP52]|nr:hypothetical protein DP73_13780 [Desulfosporosinus sp. HMP52]
MWIRDIRKTPKTLLRIIDPKDRAASIHRSEPIAWRGGKADKLGWGSGATGSHQVLPRGLAKLPPKRVGEPRSAE